MIIYLLSSSRADYTIYLPLLKKINADKFFELRIVAFGTHVSKNHGNTIENFHKDGFSVYEKIHTLPDGDEPIEISKSIGKTIQKFSTFWSTHNKEDSIIISLGDRYEMFAAVVSSVPFNFKVAHIHGGETTLGSIDNIFRHSISLISKLHFAATETAAKRIKEITANSSNIYVTGALSLDNLNEIKLLSIPEFKEKYGVNLNNPTLLCTFHPNTINFNQNEKDIETLLDVLNRTNMQVVLTLPNADTYGALVRSKIMAYKKAGADNFFIFESLGTIGYFSCMNHCSYLIGNTSSGIIEAASFSKYVINIGDRQKGREAGENVIHSAINKEQLLETIRKIDRLPKLSKHNIYGDGTASKKILETLKRITL